jgi:hypothetical protein
LRPQFLRKHNYNVTKSEDGQFEKANFRFLTGVRPSRAPITLLKGTLEERRTRAAEISGDQRDALEFFAQRAAVAMLPPDLRDNPFAVKQSQRKAIEAVDRLWNDPAD